MNKTKKITLGAMLLAIIGAVMFINRQFQLFTVLLTMGIALSIIIYGAMYTFKDSAILSFCLIVFAFILGDASTYLIVPESIIVGLGCSYGISKNCKTQTLTLIAMVLFIIGELAIAFILMPILGLGTISQQAGEFGELFNEFSSQYANAGVDISSMISIFTKPSFLMILLIVATVFTGIIEGYLLSILTRLLLKRLKIKEMGSFSLLGIKMSPAMAYVLFILSALGLFFSTKLLSGEENTIYYIIFVSSIIPFLILVYYGYIYFLINVKLRSGAKAGFIVILVVIFLMPLSLYVLMIVGFLYGSGPLREKLERKIATTSNINN